MSFETKNRNPKSNGTMSISEIFFLETITRFLIFCCWSYSKKYMKISTYCTSEKYFFSLYSDIGYIVKSYCVSREILCIFIQFNFWMNKILNLRFGIPSLSYRIVFNSTDKDVSILILLSFVSLILTNETCERKKICHLIFA